MIHNKHPDTPVVAEHACETGMGTWTGRCEASHKVKECLQAQAMHTIQYQRAASGTKPTEDFQELTREAGFEPDQAPCGSTCPSCLVLPQFCRTA